MNAKFFLVVMAVAFVCIAAKSRAPFRYDDEVSFNVLLSKEGGGGEGWGQGVGGGGKKCEVQNSAYELGLIKKPRKLSTALKLNLSSGV